MKPNELEATDLSAVRGGAKVLTPAEGLVGTAQGVSEGLAGSAFYAGQFWQNLMMAPYLYMTQGNGWGHR